MSGMKITVGTQEFEMDTSPRGHAGVVHLRDAKGQPSEARFRRDAHGIWIELDGGVYGFDLETSVNDDGQTTYRVTERLKSGDWEQVTTRRAGEGALASGAAGAKKSLKIKAQMPGKIVRVFVTEGASVKRDQPLLVMEAMKMENEIRSPQDGRVKSLTATPGQTVETGAALLMIEPESGA